MKNNQCKGKIKRAHSIQKNRIPKRISQNGNVISFQQDKSAEFFDINLNRKERKKHQHSQDFAIIMILKSLNQLNCEIMKKEI